MPAARKRKNISYTEDSDAGSVSSEASFGDDGGDDESVTLDNSESEEVKPKKKASTPTKGKPKAEKSKSPASKSKKNPKEATPTKPAAASKGFSAGPVANSVTVSVPSSSSAMISSSSGPDITQGPPVTTDAATKKLLLQYMKQQNRPYSLLQIFDNLHKRIPKATLERVLTTMSGTGGELLCKEYSKSKIYYMDQSSFGSGMSTNQLESLQEENSILKEELDELKAKGKSLHFNLNQIISEPSDADMDK
jgi:hypothetical protein